MTPFLPSLFARLRWTRLCFLSIVVLGGLGASCVARAEDVVVKDVLRIDIINNGIVFDPHSQKIYASIPSYAGRGGNSIVALDPKNGEVGTPLPVGSEPGGMCLSDDGKYLYVLLHGSGEIRRVDLPEKKADLQFPVPGGLRGMAILPGQRDRLVVSRGGEAGLGSGIAILEKGLMLPQTGLPNRFAISFPQRVFTYQNEISSWDFCTYSVGAKGLEFRGSTGSLLVGNLGMLGDGNGRIYTHSQVIDPEQRRILGGLPCPGSDIFPLIDPQIGRIFYLAGNRITTASYSTFVTLETLVVPDIGEGANNLIRWGEDGLALRTAKQVLVFRCKGLWKPVPPADLEVKMERKPDKVTVGQSYTLTLTVTNRGGGVANGVTLTCSLPEDLKFVRAALSQEGQVLPVNGVIATKITSLKPKQRATMTLVVTPVGAKKFLCTAVVRGDEPDPHPENNVLDYEIDNTEPPPTAGKIATATHN